jgi:hypothetical protein
MVDASREAGASRAGNTATVAVALEDDLPYFFPRCGDVELIRFTVHGLPLVALQWLRPPRS